MVNQKLNKLFAAAVEPELSAGEVDDLYNRLMQRIDFAPSSEPTTGNGTPAAEPAASAAGESTAATSKTSGAFFFKALAFIAVATVGSAYLSGASTKIASATAILPEVSGLADSPVLHRRPSLAPAREPVSQRPTPTSEPTPAQSSRRSASAASFPHTTTVPQSTAIINDQHKPSATSDTLIESHKPVPPKKLTKAQTSTPPKEPGMPRESDLIKRARLLLYTNPAAAEVSLSMHERFYPNGVLQAVREKLRAELQRNNNQKQRP